MSTWLTRFLLGTPSLYHMHLHLAILHDHTHLSLLQGTMFDTILRQVFEYRIPLIVLSLTSGTHHLPPCQNNPCRWYVLSPASLIYRIIIYPLYISPLRHLPGPPLFNVSPWYNPLSWITAPVKGQFPHIINGEAGIPQRAWLKQYGGEKGVIRVVGPLGIERLIFLSPEACERILVKDWTEYPRACFSLI